MRSWSSVRSVLAWAPICLLAAIAHVAHGDEPPAACAKPSPHATGAVEPLFELLRLDRLERLRADFSEEKHIALLARPLRGAGQLYFDRNRGIARVTRSPAPERVVVSTTTLRIEKAGRVEEVPLDRSKSLRGFAVIFPALLRGDRAALEATFDLDVEGDAKGAWSLTLLPKDPALCGLIRRVVVSGQGPEVRALRVEETSGDTTETRLSATVRNEAVPPAEIAEAFGAK
jgi:Outer membrane lipoprotein carrier protein LolA-like